MKNKIKDTIAILTGHLSGGFTSGKTINFSECEIPQKSFRSKTSRPALLVNAVLLLFLALSLTSGEAKAASFVVNMTTDANDADTGDGVCDSNLATAGAQCTLRAAIQQANTQPDFDAISFSLALPATINLTINELLVVHTVSINGPGARDLTVRRASNAGDFRVFDIFAPNSNVAISGITVSNGKLGSIANGNGAGIINSNDSNLTLTDVTVASNTAVGSGGGVYNMNAQLTISRSTFSNNTAQHGGGVNNNNGGTASIVNSTFSGNAATDGGVSGVYATGGGITNTSQMTLTNVTVSGNAASDGGGGVANIGTCNVRNTIIAGNTSSTSPSTPDLPANNVFNSQGNNLIGISNGTNNLTNGVSGDKVGTSAAPINAMLGALQNNGGQTNTRALSPGSPAVDAGNNCVTLVFPQGCSFAPLTTDQRGAGFSRQIDGDDNGTAIIDIGAFEAETAPTLSVSDVSLIEGNQNTTNFNFIVTMSAVSAQTVSVNYQTAGVNATSGVDFANTSGTLTFAPGETGKQITVPVIGDTTPETNEQFHLNLSAPVNAILSDGQGVGTIKDDDNHGLLKFKSAPYSGTEGNSVSITVERAYGTTGDISVQVSTSGGTATPGVDYTQIAGSLTFEDGESIKSFTINLPDDQTGEPTEDFNVILSNPTGGANLGVPSNTTVSIQDNDQPPTASIKGLVSYANTPVNQQLKYVPKAMLSAIGDTAVSVPTDFNGAYALENLTAGSAYTVTASKVGDVNGISPFDATLVLKHVAANGQGPNALNANQQKAADANGDGNISPFDATLILRYVAAGGPNANTGQTGNWKFLPGTQNYQSLNNSLSGENYEAVLIGEVNGDWMPPAPGSLAEMDNQGEIAASVEEAEAEISLPDNASAASGSIIVVPVTFANKSGKSISGYSFDVAFDPNVLQPDSAMPIERSATLSQEMTVVHNTAQAGRLGIAASGGNSIERISKGDVMLKLRFRTVGRVNDLKNPATALTFHRQPIIENESGTALTVKSANGSVRLSAGGAGKSVTTVLGQVTTADGRGIRNVSVTLTGANGETRTVMTGAGGEYRFTDVSAGETYTISVSSKRFGFNTASQMRTIFAEAEEINFTALE